MPPLEVVPPALVVVDVAPPLLVVVSPGDGNGVKLHAANVTGAPNAAATTTPRKRKRKLIVAS